MARGRIAVFLTNAHNDYLRMVAADARASGRPLDLDVDVSFADNEPIAQIQQIYACLRETGAAQPRGVLVMPVSDESLARVARGAVGGGVGWVSLFRRPPYIDELARKHPQVPVFVSSPDHTAIGRIQARQILALLAGRGQVLFVKGMASSSSTQARYEATLADLRGTGVEIVGEIDGNWAEDTAAREVDRWLRLLGSFEFKRLDLVACHNDMMARGTLRALQAAAAALGRPELAQVPVIGADGLVDVGRRMVDVGSLAATIVLPSPAAPALQALERALFRGTPPPPEILLPCTGYPDEGALAARSRRGRTSS
jgi:ABC-type sugar transport system substrate-binding protein